MATWNADDDNPGRQQGRSSTAPGGRGHREASRRVERDHGRRLRPPPPARPGWPVRLCRCPLPPVDRVPGPAGRDPRPRHRGRQGGRSLHRTSYPHRGLRRDGAVRPVVRGCSSITSTCAHHSRAAESLSATAHRSQCPACTGSRSRSRRTSTRYSTRSHPSRRNNPTRRRCGFVDELLGDLPLRWHRVDRYGSNKQRVEVVQLLRRRSR